MNSDDLNFAYKVRHALNDIAEDIPATTADRLCSARKVALSRKKPHAPVQLARGQLAGGAGAFFSFSTLGRMGVAIPLLALVAGLAGIVDYEERKRTAEMAELDAALLADDLPLTAYLDPGFNAYLTQKKQ